MNRKNIKLEDLEEISSPVKEKEIKMPHLEKVQSQVPRAPEHMSFRHRPALKTPKDTTDVDFEEPFDEKKRLLGKNEYDEDYDKQRKEIDSIYTQYGDT